MMKSIFFVLLILFIAAAPAPGQQSDTLFAAFWNMENLFDTTDDPVKDDAEWLPTSEKEWSGERLNQKMSNMSAIIKMMNDSTGPDILGMCEVENDDVVTKLISQYLGFREYALIHDDSPDNRGIDVALIYDDRLFDFISFEGLEVSLPDKYPTRDILYAVIKNNNNDTLHIFVNHWPSRRGGEESELGRVIAADVLKLKTDELFLNNPAANIIIMGDFNDEPNNRSILSALKAEPFLCSEADPMPEEMTGSKSLFNASYQKFHEGEGSYKYRDDWNMLDQIIISGSMLGRYICGSFTVYKPEAMVTRSGNYAGTPFPTFGGRRYLGGYSDHFPVYAKFITGAEQN